MGVIVTSCKTGLFWAGIVCVSVMIVLPARETTGEVEDAAVIMIGLDPNGIPGVSAIMVLVGMIGAWALLLPAVRPIYSGLVLVLVGFQPSFGLLLSWNNGIFQ